MIGVVAGVGPYAGLDLLNKILAQTIAEKDQDHLSVASLSQPGPIPDRTAFLLGQTSTNPALPMVEQLLKLEQIGATVAGIPCNTAHAPRIFERIRRGLKDEGSKLKLLNMIVEVGREVQSVHPRVKRIGVLSTSGTAVAGIYPLILEPLGFDIVAVDQALQEQSIQPAIYDPEYGIKACGRGSEKARANLILGARHLRQKGAEAVILGCTEIPLAIPEKQVEDMIVVDPTLILARALIAAINPARLLQH